MSQPFDVVAVGVAAMKRGVELEDVKGTVLGMPVQMPPLRDLVNSSSSTTSASFSSNHPKITQMITFEC